MKKILMIGMLSVVAFVTVSAQNVIWKDDFEGDKGWQTYEYKKQYKSEYSKDGKLLLRAYEAGIKCMSTCKTSLNPIKNFSILVEATTKVGLIDNCFFGVAFNCLDRNNYSLFVVEKGVEETMNRFNSKAKKN